MYDLVIKNGIIVDGSGEKPFKGDIAVSCGKIVNIADKIDDEAKEVIDAKGNYVTPGFLDIHRHGDAKVFTDGYGEIELRQGITTVVNGQCGLSIMPCTDKYREEMYDFLAPIVGNVDRSLKYNSFKDYLELLKTQKLRLNVGSCVGNGAVRMAVSGFSDKSLTDEQIAAAQKLLRQSLEDGALGVTLGLVYAPECHYSFDELIKVLSPMKDFDVPLVTHMRGEGMTLLKSIKEVIAIAKEMGVKLHISHFKVVGKQHWGHVLDEALALIEEANKQGTDVSFDAYPYTAGATQLLQYLPPEYLEGGSEKITERLKDADVRNKIADILRQPQEYFENLCLETGWEGTLITTLSKPENRQFLGMTVSEISKKLNKDPFEVAFELLVDEKCNVGMFNFTASEEDNRRIISNPRCNVISDSLYADGGLAHPRVYCAFPRVLETFVKEEGLFPIETAVYKITKKAADVYNLNSKGLIKEGMDADFVIFDLNKIHAAANYKESEHLATGYDYVIVNGVAAVKDDVLLDSFAGKVL